MSIHTDSTPVDSLIRELGDVLVAAETARLDRIVVAAIDLAILETTHVVGAAIRDPQRVDVSQAHAAIQRTAQLIAALTTETARSRRLVSTAAGLKARRRRMA